MKIVKLQEIDRQVRRLKDVLAALDEMDHCTRLLQKKTRLSVEVNKAEERLKIHNANPIKTALQIVDDEIRQQDYSQINGLFDLIEVIEDMGKAWKADREDLEHELAAARNALALTAEQTRGIQERMRALQVKCNSAYKDKRQMRTNIEHRIGNLYAMRHWLDSIEPNGDLYDEVLKKTNQAIDRARAVVRGVPE